VIVGLPRRPAGRRVRFGCLLVAVAVAALAACAHPGSIISPDTHQLIVVNAADYGETTATLTAYDGSDGDWQVVFGPWPVRIGRAGFAPPGDKREGDGMTPTGTFDFPFLFGIQPDPGVQFEYRPIPDSSIVWDDDPASPNYNLWVDTALADAGANPEPMYNAPAYDYGAVIDYNPFRAPGFGSAIFLHESTGDATVGCVSLPEAQLLQILRWLNALLAARIRMGVGVGP
jgi:L,D-peptidoglycan transpeptidase YkuD (ErfK/YbiS/YcfS/YnhG family)